MSPQLQDTLGMFVFLAVELSVLFIGISALVGVLQRHIPPAKVEALLSSTGTRGYLLAAGLGAITPFCSCSTIPMLKGLIRARAGFGPMMVFLFSSPLLNPVVVVLLAATFGLTLTSTYVIAALAVSLGAGWLMHAFGFERYIRRTATKETGGCGSSQSQCGAAPAVPDCGSPKPIAAALGRKAPAATPQSRSLLRPAAAVTASLPSERRRRENTAVCGGMHGSTSSTCYPICSSALRSAA